MAVKQRADQTTLISMNSIQDSLNQITKKIPAKAKTLDEEIEEYLAEDVAEDQVVFQQKDVIPPQTKVVQNNILANVIG